ncbi:TorF family putative porin [Candidatus Thiothrix anitrata]|uniref:TorF family putative porin n=1 Tax=Candidatus Thiothrix anitrata TaxID=2823902 RepID=A0ABX7X4K5_9GAMM|nr:TorF family putative porin [Candidatus Thiothrix anitrata]QTR50337.1 TorF family putative porin [Candidatus Thiothrix anitrata]
MKNGVLLTATLLGSLLISAQAVAGASANIGATSNYIWRGATQTGDEAAISGGLDYEAANGWYAGTWTSSLGGGGQYELDIYGGYAGKTASDVEYDVGAIHYAYPVGKVDLDFTEVYGKVGYKGVGAEIAYTVDKEDKTIKDKNDLYYSLGYEGSIKEDLGYAVKVGKYDFDGGKAGDYSHVDASLTKGEFTFGVSKRDLKGDKSPKVYVSWSKALDF